MSLSELGNEAWSAAVCAFAAGLPLAAIPIVPKEFTFLRPIFFGLGVGAIVLFLWISKLLPVATGTPGNSEDSRLFLGLIAVVISTFTGFALKITFDQAQDTRKIRDEMREQMDNFQKKMEELTSDQAQARKIRDEMRKQMEKFQTQVKRTERLAWIINEIATYSRFPDQSPTNYTALSYLAKLYKNPQETRHRSDLSLDVFIARSEMRKIMDYDDRKYVHWLAEHFDSPFESLKQEVREQAAELHALLQDDQSQI